ncbi:hypothetical protein Misp01_76400 [Microtetraspora sp. NBRC 13810]|uniref:FxLD family lanthipeptide n=1 Tax=Microtetraspora sp. NBRC 13810 TaxID=3030990 RepID=UPI0024A51E61|nr:FxLD family lanthipeptide [Microtetraspora sp. NBRC 13810]GLW12512.1 hypothetical protein Misp01_76400 [Microtetraspora sp. NBRC 13810]
MLSPTTITANHEPATVDVADPFQLDITFIENTPAADTVLMCSTGDNCGTSCPSACPTS